MMPDGSWIRIENLSELLLNFKPEIHHPDDPRYRPFWQSLRKKFIEGIWVEQFGKWRYMSGRLGFYGNMFKFVEWDELEGTRIIGRPDIRDLEWHRAYYRAEMDGFSGWENDDEYTSDRIIFDIDSGIRIHPKRLAALHNSKGDLKIFKEPRVNLFELHDRPKGKPLYYNEASNHLEFGARGSGKSYFEAGAEILFDLVFHSRKYYDPGDKSSSIAELEVTSAGGGKATELLEKVQQGMDFLADPEHPELGVYKYTNGSIEPCPFWKEMRGDISANNKENKWRATKKIKVDGVWKETPTQGYIINTSYSINTKGGGRKSAGGRRTKVTHEECFGINTPVRMADFSVKMIQDIKVGDSVLGVDGKAKIVTNVNRGKKELVKVIQTKGIDYITTKDHLLYTEQRTKYKKWTSPSDGIHLCTYKDIMSKPSYYRQTTYGKNNSLLEFKEQDTFIIPPYLLGIYLGDGNRGSGTITVGKNEEKVIEKYLKEYALDNDYNYSCNEAPTANYINIGNGKGRKSEYKEKLKELGVLTEKFIPEIYLRNSEQKRLELLAGLIDTDGCKEGKKYFSYSIDQKSERLAKDIRFLAKSLGFDVSFRYSKYKTKNTKSGFAERYRMHIKGEIWKIPVRIKRKQVISYKLTNVLNSSGLKFEEIGINDYYGISLKNTGKEEDRLFLLEDGTIVHNCGENILLLDSWGSNEGMVAEAGHKMASQKGIGTSGDMETIEPAKKIFTHPRSYKCLVFKYPEYPEDEHCFFIPVHIADRRFKDKDGNTDIKAAKEFHEKQLQAKLDANDPPDVIINHKVNYPIKIEDMWYSTRGNILPTLEAEAREKELMKGGLYKSIGTSIELYFDNSEDTGVGYKLLNNANPFYNFPFDSDHVGDLEGAIRMFIHPSKLKINGVIPKDAIFSVIDPYVAGEWDKGGSLGSISLWVNPKYISYGLPGNCMVAAYHGKPFLGVERFAEICVMLHAFYGDSHNAVWYEAVKGGDIIRNCFIKRNRFLCLAHRPQFENGHWIVPTKITQTGYLVTGGNTGLAKRALWTALNDWLLTEVELTIDGVTETKRVIERIPDIFLIRQIKEAKLNGLNVDAVSALQPISIAIGEQEMRMALKTNQGENLSVLQNYVKNKAKYKK